MDDAEVLAAVDTAAREIAAARGLDAVLRRLADLARELTGAAYAAVGLPDGAGGFERFVTAGMDDDTIAEIGWLPRVHGMLGAMLHGDGAELVADVTDDPRFDRYPAAHPVMRSLLGAPVVRDGDLVGALYVADDPADSLDADDLAAVERLTPHAAVAIGNARTDELLAERSVRRERDRLARDLHDAITQRVMGLRLAVTTADEVLDADPDEAHRQLATAAETAGEVATELRSLVEQLRPPDLQREGLPDALAKHARLLVRGDGGPEVGVHADRAHPVDDGVAAELLRIGREALSNAVRHGDATRIDIDVVTGREQVTLAVRDDGRGVDPVRLARDTGSLGLQSMRARAEQLGGRMRIDSTPGEGTRVVVSVPRQTAEPGVPDG